MDSSDDKTAYAQREQGVATSSSASSMSAYDAVEKVEEAQAPTSTPPQDAALQEEDEYPPFAKQAVIMTSLFLSMFLIALDRLIISTAIPTLTNEFQSFGDIGWYGSAYLLTSCALQIFAGRLYTFYNPKWTFLIFILFFEVGSAICGAAPNSVAFIWGRAIAGAASAGVQNGCIVLMMAIIPLHKRPIWQGLFGAVFGISSIAGPLIGGAFTSNVSWRWCFYINLPIGAVVMLINLFILRLPDSAAKKAKVPAREQLRRLDPIGTLVFIGVIVCLLLALQWGGTTYAWDSGTIIALFVCFGVGLIGFAILQIWTGNEGIIPINIITNRTIAAAGWYGFCSSGSMLTIAYWLPVWFQAIKGSSPVQSGIMLLPLLLSMVVFSIASGITIQKIGYYAPFMVAGSVVLPIGSGLMSTFTPSTGSGMWIGYQIIFGAGLGMGLQQPMLAVQNTLSKLDAPTGVALMFFFITLGGAIFVSVGQALLNNALTSGFAHISGLNISPADLARQGATDLRGIVPAAELSSVLDVYNKGLVDTFYIAVGLSAVSIFGAVLVKWKKIAKPPKAAKPGNKDAAAKDGDAAEKV